MVQQEKIRVPEGTVTLVRLTEAAKALLAAGGVQVKPFPKNASLEHEYWKQRVAEDYRQRGYGVEKEVALGDGKAVDLVATNGAERIAIEIETGKSKIETNARKCRSAGFSDVITVQTWARPSRAGPRQRRV